MNLNNHLIFTLYTIYGILHKGYLEDSHFHDTHRHYHHSHTPGYTTP